MHPHDTFFARLLGRRENAREVLRWLLPADLSAQLDWRTLRAAPTTSHQGTQRRGDLAFWVRTIGGAELGIHLLLEHQHAAELRMIFRMVEYQARDWMRQLEIRRPLTRIVPIVLYNGRRPWPHPTSLHEVMPEDGLESAMAGLQLRGEFLLLDLSQVPDEVLAHTALGVHLRLGLWLLKHAPRLREADFWARFRTWLHGLAEIYALPDGPSRLEAVLDYIGHVVGEPSEEDLQTITAALPVRATETVMTWAEALTQRGIEQGRAQGIEQGKVQGRTVQARETLVRMLRSKFGDPSEPVRSQIEQATLQQLENWLDRVLEANSLDQVLAD